MPIVKPGSDWDVNGCINSAGYVWCQILGKCLRTWEEACAYPPNCLTWNDGCNNCMIENGALTICTGITCLINKEPECIVWDPTPMVINPFIAEGH
jgi:hypothetical protein